MSDIYNPIGVISLEGLIGNLTFESSDGFINISVIGKNIIDLTQGSTPPVKEKGSYNVINSINSVTQWSTGNNWGNYY